MDAINNNQSNNAVDLLNLLHTIHPTHPDGKDSLWCLIADSGEGTDNIRFMNLSCAQFEQRFDLSSTKWKIDRSKSGRVVYTFVNLSHTFHPTHPDRKDGLWCLETDEGGEERFTLHVEDNYVENDYHDFFHGGEWVKRFG